VLIAKPVLIGDSQWYISEFWTSFLNWVQRSVNGKAECDFDTLSGGLPWTLVD